jgi:hypothetical protein
MCKSEHSFKPVETHPLCQCNNHNDTGFMWQEVRACMLQFVTLLSTRVTITMLLLNGAEIAQSV